MIECVVFAHALRFARGYVCVCGLTDSTIKDACDLLVNILLVEMADQTPEDRDTALAERLRDAETREHYDVFDRFLAVVRAGDIDALRSVFEGRAVLILGGESQGRLEQTVLTEVMNNSGIRLDLLGVFFKELGGRFMVDARYGMCVFSMLIMIDCAKNIVQVEEVERWTVRMAEVVRYLVENVGYPIRMRQEYRVRPLATTGTLMTLARDTGAWASYMAFAQFIRPAPFLNLLEKLIRESFKGEAVRSSYWFKRFATGMFAEDVDDVVIWNLSQLPNLLPERAAFLHAEGVRRVQLKQALLLLQDQYSSNVWQRELMRHSELSRVILTRAFEDTPFCSGPQ